MANELWSTLLRFHREVVLPDFELKLHGPITQLRADMGEQLGRIFRKMDKMIAEAESFQKEHEQ